MNFVGHHAGTLRHPTYYPSIPRQPMKFFDQPIWSVKSSTIAICGFQTDEEREIMALKERIHSLQSQLDSYDRLFRFAGRISKKLICIGQMSDAEIISALKFGIDIKLDDTRWSFRLPVWKIDNFTEIDEDFLRLNGELKDFRDASCQYPAIEEVVEDSTIVLHKGEDLFSENSDSSFLDEFGNPLLNMAMNGNFDNTGGMDLATSDSLFGMDGFDDTLLMTPYINQIYRIKRIKSSTSKRLQEALASARDISRIASEIAKHVSNANNSKFDLVGKLSEAMGGISDTATAVEEVEPPTRPSTKNRGRMATGIPVRVQVPLPQVEIAITVEQENVEESPENLSDEYARPKTAKAEPKCRSKVGPKDNALAGPKDRAIAGPSAGLKDQAIAGPSARLKDQAIAGPSAGPKDQNQAGPKGKRTGAKSCDYVTHAKAKINPRKTLTPFKYSRPKAVDKGIVTHRLFNRTFPLAVTAIPVANNPPNPINLNIVPGPTDNEN